MSDTEIPDNPGSQIDLRVCVCVYVCVCMCVLCACVCVCAYGELDGITRDYWLNGALQADSVNLD